MLSSCEPPGGSKDHKENSDQHIDVCRSQECRTIEKQLWGLIVSKLFKNEHNVKWVNTTTTQLNPVIFCCIYSPVMISVIVSFKKVNLRRNQTKFFSACFKNRYFCSNVNHLEQTFRLFINYKVWKHSVFFCLLLLAANRRSFSLYSDRDPSHFNH